ncbi:restriction endonuclease subunit S [Salinibacter ruber]|uniref:restriction endonuclease subunit S n=1 Tax=Salinibacter ruber TaxID=146919 RepID=UPI00216A0056|nr:restriction endonuclease subunit S [Salinibacter ruber]MCS3612679.1 type I restriction enzyme S subunit [Salinibacter ruber]
MSDDLDFDMEVVEDDELDEMGAGEGSSSGDPSRSKRNEGKEKASESTGAKVKSLESGTTGSVGAGRTTSPGKKTSEVKSSDESSSEPARKTVYGHPPEDWSVKRLGEVAQIVSGSSLPKDMQDESQEGSPVYKVSDMNEKGNEKYLGKASNYLESEELDEIGHTLHPPGSTLLPKVGAALLTNKRRMLTRSASFDNNIMGWVPDGVNEEFLYYVSCVTDMDAVAQMGAVPSISKSIAEKLKVPVPPLPEQRKIASVLYAVDQAIQKTEAIIEQAKRVKRGLMQDLFGKAGNSHSGRGGKEFWIGPKKFEVPEHWEKTKIREIGRVVTGDTPSTDDENNFGGSLPFVTPSDLKRTKYVVETDRTLSAQGRGQAKPIPEGSVMIDCIGSDMGKVAIAGREVATNQQINSVVVTDDEYNAEFLYYHLLVLSGYVKAQAGRTATPIVNKGDFQTFGLLKPPLEEQERVAKSLAAYDRVQSTNRGYLERLTRLKKGLVQDLLTGEVRTATKAIEVLDEVAAHG